MGECGLFGSIFQLFCPASKRFNSSSRHISHGRMCWARAASVPDLQAALGFCNRSINVTKQINVADARRTRRPFWIFGNELARFF